MRVSAIIPTTGSRPRMLERAVRSVRAQTRATQELVIVVDGDGEAMRRVEASLRAESARVLATGRPRGVSAARNLGAELATGELLAFLDDDDVWKSTYLERVLAGREPFDVALTAFEKHKPGHVRPEKIPPERLDPIDFLVKNPGLRGSNLVIRREVYQELGGVDEELPAFNDMDFGVRLSDRGPWRYRRVTRHLVEFHSHRGPRLSTPGGEANRVGMRAFWMRYEGRMTPAQRDAFRRRALQIWNIDPEEIQP